MKFLSKKVKITDVEIGDLVLSCDIDKKLNVYRTVLNTMRPIVASKHQVRIKSISGYELITSDTHPTAIFKDDKIVYVCGGDIVVGDHIVIDNAIPDLVCSVDCPEVDEQYADFSVDEHENYYAGTYEDKLVLAHNSATVTMPIWHYQFDDFIVLKNNQGTEENRVRHMDYSVVLSAFFWNRFKKNENITFFDPNEVPELYEAFYSDTNLFNKLYVEYETRTDLRKKTEKASVVFKDWLIKERTDTGRIYLVYIDNVISQTPFDVTQDPIYQSNLCLTGDTRVDVIVNGEIKNLAIKDIAALDSNVLVKSKHIETDKIVYATVSAAGLTGIKRKIILIEDEKTGKSIKCTPEHLIYTKNRGGVRQNVSEREAHPQFQPHGHRRPRARHGGACGDSARGIQDARRPAGAGAERVFAGRHPRSVGGARAGQISCALQRHRQAVSLFRLESSGDESALAKPCMAFSDEAGSGKNAHGRQAVHRQA